jgi:hypothetical protein
MMRLGKFMRPPMSTTRACGLSANCTKSLMPFSVRAAQSEQ